MKEPKNNKLVLAALIGSILLVIVTLVSVAYLSGRDVAIEDTSAAVQTEPVEINDGLISTSFPALIAQNAKYSVGMSYFGEVDTSDLPDWNISVCGKSRTFNDAQWVSFTQNFTKAGNCPVKVSVTSMGVTDGLDTKVYVHKISNNVTNNKIIVNSEEGKNSVVGVSNIGKAKKNYEDTQWKWSTIGDCSIPGVEGFTLGLDSAAIVKKTATDSSACTVKYVGYSFYSTTAVKLVGQKRLTASELSNLSSEINGDISVGSGLSELLMSEDSTDDEIVGSICGAMDTNNDGRMNIIDYAAFANVYGRGKTVCTDTSAEYGVCGAKDHDRDGRLDLTDLMSLVGRYYPISSCSL